MKINNKQATDILLKLLNNKTIIEGMLNNEIVYKKTTNTVSGIGSITLNHCKEGTIAKLVIKNACQLFFSKFTFFGPTTFFTNNNLLVEHNNNITRYKLPHSLNLRVLDNNYDEMKIEDMKMSITKRISYNASDGSLSLLRQPVTSLVGSIAIRLSKGTNTIKLESFKDAILEATYDYEYE